MKKKKATQHPDHSPHRKRLNRVRGQIDGIDKMIEQRRYCPDILIQLRAAGKALQAIETEILKTHVHSCLKTAIRARNVKDLVSKIEEIVDLVNR